MDNKYRWKSLLLPAAVALVFLFMIFSLLSGSSRPGIAYSEIIGYFEDQKVTAYSLDFGTGRLQMSLNDPEGAIVTYDVPSIEMFVNETAPYVEAYNEAHPNEKLVREWIRPSEANSWIATLLPMIVVILLGTSVGATTSAEAFLNADTLKIVALGLIAFAFGTAGGVVLGKIMCKLSGGKINPLIGSAGVSAVPMAARVSQKVGAEADPTNFLLMHAMGPNVAGVIGTAVAAGTFMAVFGVK